MVNKQTLYLLLIIILGAALRFDFLYSSNFQIESDEAIVGLMAKHHMEGGPLPVFYYGQHYMGSFEPWLVSIAYRITGVGNFGLKIIPYIFSVLLIYLSYLIAAELGDRRTGLMAAVLTACAPAALMVWGLKARGGFIELVVLGGLALYLCIRYLKSKSDIFPSYSAIALILGLSWWINFQIIYFIIPIGIFLTIFSCRKERFTRFIGASFLGIFCFFLGSLPFWIYNLENNFISQEIFLRPKTSATIDNLFGFFETALPIIMGAKRFWHMRDFVSGVSFPYYGLFTLIALIFIWQRRQQIVNLFKLKVNSDHGPELLAVFVFVTFVIFVKSSFGYLVHAPRYLLPVYIGIYPLIAFVIAAYLSRRTGVLVLSLLVILNIFSCYYKGRALEGEPYVFQQQRTSKSHSGLIKWLQKENINFVRTNYWIGYRLALETKEKTKFVVFGDPKEVRIPEYEKEGRALGIETMPLITVSEQGRLVRKALQSLGYIFKEKSLSKYKVFFDIQAPANQGALKAISPISAESNFNQEAIGAAFDNNVSTRWGSAHPQTPGMYLKLNLPALTKLSALNYQLGTWKPDYPRSLEILLESENGELRQLLTKDQYYAIKYFWDADFDLKFYFDPVSVKAVILRQQGSHDLFDWSVADISLYTTNE